MPFFKTTKNILVDPWNDELYDENWMESYNIFLPQSKKWDYSRELKIEDVNIWEVIYQQGGGLGLYASYDPYAEFYMITKHLYKMIQDGIETFYGKNASDLAYKRAIELGMPIQKRKIWIDDEDIWLYDKNIEIEKKIIIP